MASYSRGAAQLLGQEAAKLAGLGRASPLAEQPSGTPRPHTHSQPHCSPGPHPALISACCLAVPWWLRGQRSPLSPSLYTPVIFNSAYANPKSGMSSGRGPRGNGHGANFLPFLPLFLYNIQQRFSSTFFTFTGTGKLKAPGSE